MRRIVPPLVLALFLASGTLDAQPKGPASGPLASGLAALTASDYPTAEKELASVKGAGEADAKLGLAQAAFEQGKYADADRLAQAAASSAAHKVKAAVMRAQVMAATGKKQDAIKLLDTV
jgi:predicted Zn-dependent protease